MRWPCWSFSWVKCPLLQVCVCVSTAPSVCVCVCVCALGWVKYREHISLLVILCVIVFVTKKINIYISVIGFFQNRYPIMVKCLNIGKPIYRSFSSHLTLSLLLWKEFLSLCKCQSLIGFSFISVSRSRCQVWSMPEVFQRWLDNILYENTDRWGC